MASSLSPTAGSRKVKSIQLAISPLSYNIVGVRILNKLHPENHVDAQFSAFFQTAATWLDGSTSGWKVYDRLLDKDIFELSERVTVVADEGLGNLQTRLEVIYGDGSSEAQTCEAPLGEVSNPLSTKHIRQKFESLAVPVLGIQKAGSIASLINSVEDRTVGELVKLLTTSI